MSESLDSEFQGLDGPRPLEVGFRGRLQSSMIEATSPEGEPQMAPEGLSNIDGPRDMPAQLHKRLEAAILGRRLAPPRTLMPALAAASAVILIAGATLLVRGEAPAPPPRTAPLPSPSPNPSPKPPPPPGSLRGFGSAGEFLGYVRGEALQLVNGYGIPHVSAHARSIAVPSPAGQRALSTGTGGAAAESGGEAPAFSPPEPAAGRQFSPTNVQEAGVDEPDMVKTDGRRIAIMTPQRVWLLSIASGAVRIDGATDLANGIGIFFHGDRLIHLGHDQGDIADNHAGSPPVHRTLTKVTVVDIGDLTSPRITSAMTIEGSYVGARMSRGVLRLVVQSPSLGPPLDAPADGSPARLARSEAVNRQAVRTSVVGDWLPHYVLERSGRRTLTGHVHEWEAISRPPDRAGVSMLTVLTIDPEDPRPDNAVSVLGSGDIIYSAVDNLYVTSNRLDDLVSLNEGVLPDKAVTRIHKFDISDPLTTRYVASGEVPGYLLNQFSMSEHEAALRVASTVGFPWEGGPGSQSFVTVLEESAGKLIAVGSVGNLGIGERIYSVRFIGTMGYVVTFRQVDPLYVIDLRDPQKPQVKGELKIPGYSAYLHPLSESLLLGVGRAADEQGRPLGLQFSLFDVSDPAAPTRLHERIVGGDAYTEVESDHHSFLWWPPTNLMGVPAVIYQQESESSGFSEFAGALMMTVTRESGFSEPTRVTHMGREGLSNSGQIRRSLVVETDLITISLGGLLVSDLHSLAERQWVPLQL